MRTYVAGIHLRVSAHPALPLDVVLWRGKKTKNKKQRIPSLFGGLLESERSPTAALVVSLVTDIDLTCGGMQRTHLG